MRWVIIGLLVLVAGCKKDDEQNDLGLYLEVQSCDTCEWRVEWSGFYVNGLGNGQIDLPEEGDYCIYATLQGEPNHSRYLRIILQPIGLVRATSLGNPTLTVCTDDTI